MQSIWVRYGIIRTWRAMPRNHSDWTGNGTVSFRVNFRTEWEFCSDWCGIIRKKLEITIQIEKEWIVIVRMSHSNFLFEGVHASETVFAFIRNRSKWFGDVRIQTDSILSETCMRITDGANNWLEKELVLVYFYDKLTFHYTWCSYSVYCQIEHTIIFIKR